MNLAYARMILKEGTSIEKISPPDWSVGGPSRFTMGTATLELVVTGAKRKQVETLG